MHNSSAKMRTVLVILCFFLTSVAGWAKEVLLIESYNQELAWDREIIVGLKSVIEPHHRLLTYALQTHKIDKSQFAGEAQKAFQHYLKLKPDVVVLADDNAFAYMLPLLHDEPISIVFLGVSQNPRRWLETYRGQSHVTGVLDQPLLVKNIGRISQFLPATKRKILVLCDSGNTAQIVKENMHGQYQLIKTNFNVEVQFVTLLTVRTWQRAVKLAEHNHTGAIFVGVNNHLTNSSGETVDNRELIAWTSRHSAVPVFSFWNFMVGKGKAVGGVVVTGRYQGVLAGRSVRKIIDEGIDANDIPISEKDTGVGLYSPSEMARWQLSPPESWKALDE